MVDILARATNPLRQVMMERSKPGGMLVPFVSMENHQMRVDGSESWATEIP